MNIITRAIDSAISDKEAGIGAYLTALEGLDIIREDILRGPSQQLNQLKRIRPIAASALIRVHPVCNWVFQHLRDIYSLCPCDDLGSRLLEAFLRYTSPRAVASLKKYASRKTIYLHVSCNHLIAKAHDSIRSFREPREEEAHIVVIGRHSQYCEPFISFDVKRNILQIQAPDNYEGLHKKVLFAIATLESICRPEFIIKCDDDVRMSDRSRLDNLINELKQQKIQYAGTVNHIQNSKDFCRSWHTGKCSKGKLNRTGMQHFVPGKYIDGGSCYILGSKSIQELSDSFFYQRLTIENLELGYEDVLVGLILEQAGIKAIDVDIVGQKDPRGDFAGLTIAKPSGQPNINPEWNHNANRKSSSAEEWATFQGRLKKNNG